MQVRGRCNEVSGEIERKVEGDEERTVGTEAAIGALKEQSETRDEGCRSSRYSREPYLAGD